MEIIDGILISVIVLLVIGFLIGFIRSWKKSLTRFIILLSCLLLSLFLSPVIAKAILNSCTDGTNLSIFSLNIDFGEIVANIIGNSDVASDLAGASDATNQLIIAFMNVVVNLAIFVVMFIVLYILSLIVYWIVFAILSSKSKKKYGEKPKKNFGLRFVGGFIGVLSMFVISFVFMIPIFGVMNICDKFVVEMQTEGQASAYTIDNYSGGLFYTDDKTIGSVETYIERYAGIKKEYDESALGKFMNGLGISKAGSSAFSYLTNVTVTSNYGTLNFNLTNELYSIINVYNLYKENFLENKFNIENNDSIDSMIKIYDNAVKSEVLKNYVVELLPTLCNKWSNGEPFLGVNAPVSEEYQELFKHTLAIFDSSNINIINSNVHAFADTLKVINNYNVLTTLKDNGKIEDVFAANNDFVKELVLALSSTNELKNNVPLILNDFIKVAYKTIVGNVGAFENNELSREEIASINWGNEAETIQDIIKGLFNIYNSMNSSDNSGTLLNELGRVGIVIDDARNSVILSNPLKVFMVGFIDSEKVQLSNDVKKTITDTINDSWDSKTFKFEDLFNTIQETAYLVEDIIESVQNITLENLQDTLIKIVDSEDVKKTVQTIINSDIVQDLVGSDESGVAGVLTDLVGSFLENTNSETINKDIAAGEHIVNIVVNSNNNGSIFNSDTPVSDQAKVIVEELSNSKAVMDVINAANSNNNEVINQMVDKVVKEEDKEVLAESINKLEDEEHRAALNKFFGITA